MIVGRFVDRPEALVAQRDAVDVAEQHGAAHAELAASPARTPSAMPCGSFNGSVASAVKCLPRESIASLNSSFTIDASRAAVAGVSTMRARRRQRDRTCIDDAFAVEHVLPVGEIAVPAHGDVVDLPDNAASGCRRLSTVVLHAALARLQRLSCSRGG